MDLFWQYSLVFIAAAAPWLEIVVVIPVAIGAGLEPLPVMVVSFVGNALPVLGIISLFDWWEQRRGPVRRHWQGRAMRVWTRWGMPGLALASPALTGIHLATIMALALRADRRATALWMILSLALWTIGTGLATVLGIDNFREVFGFI